MTCPWTTHLLNKNDKGRTNQESTIQDMVTDMFVSTWPQHGSKLVRKCLQTDNNMIHNDIGRKKQKNEHTIIKQRNCFCLFFIIFFVFVFCVHWFLFSALENHKGSLRDASFRGTCATPGTMRCECRVNCGDAPTLKKPTAWSYHSRLV